MKHTALRHRKSAGLPITWRDANYGALRAAAPDRFDDRVSDDVFDAEGEREEVDNIIHAMNHGTN